MTAQILTQARLQELLHYDPETGIFTNRTTRGRFRAGSTTGSLHPRGYLAIRIDRKSYLAHRLAWMYTTGEWPSADTDHINGVRTDNRLVNLRAVSRKQNSENRGKNSNNTSGYKGVSWAKREKKWQANIKHYENCFFLGYFDNIENAREAYLAANAQLFTHNERTAE